MKTTGAVLKKLCDVAAEINPGRTGMWMFVLAAQFLLAGCLGDGAQIDPSLACSEKRLNVALLVYEDAKQKYMEHIKTRSDSSLDLSYHTADDSIRVARSVRYCADFSETIKIRATDIILANKYLQRLAMSTMRDSDPSVAISLLGEEYREIYKNDIN